jgi:hypothetical protein
MSIDCIEIGEKMGVRSVELLNACQQVAAAFIQAGILKEAPAPTSNAPEQKEIAASTAKPTDGKSPIDNLEREVASLLHPDKRLSDDRRFWLPATGHEMKRMDPLRPSES